MCVPGPVLSSRENHNGFLYRARAREGLILRASPRSGRIDARNRNREARALLTNSGSPRRNHCEQRALEARRAALCARYWLCLRTCSKGFHDFVRRDDVFRHDFTSVIILQSRQSIDITAIATRLGESRRFQAIYTNDPAVTHESLPQGPSFIHDKSIHQAWKLYDDHLDAFVVPTIAGDVANPTR